MRRPIRSLLIAGCLIAMTLFLIGCEEEIVYEPTGSIDFVFADVDPAKFYAFTGEIAGVQQMFDQGLEYREEGDDTPSTPTGERIQENDNTYTIEVIDQGAWTWTVYEYDLTQYYEEGGFDSEVPSFEHTTTIQEGINTITVSFN